MITRLHKQGTRNLSVRVLSVGRSRVLVFLIRYALVAK